MIQTAGSSVGATFTDLGDLCLIEANPHWRAAARDEVIAKFSYFGNVLTIVADDYYYGLHERDARVEIDARAFPQSLTEHVKVLSAYEEDFIGLILDSVRTLNQAILLEMEYVLQDAFYTVPVPNVIERYWNPLGVSGASALVEIDVVEDSFCRTIEMSYSFSKDEFCIDLFPEFEGKTLRYRDTDFYSLAHRVSHIVDADPFDYDDRQQLLFDS